MTRKTFIAFMVCRVSVERNICLVLVSAVFVWLSRGNIIFQIVGSIFWFSLERGISADVRILLALLLRRDLMGSIIILVVRLHEIRGVVSGNILVSWFLYWFFIDIVCRVVILECRLDDIRSVVHGFRRTSMLITSTDFANTQSCNVLIRRSLAIRGLVHTILLRGLILCAHPCVNPILYSLIMIFLLFLSFMKKKFLLINQLLLYSGN